MLVSPESFERTLRHFAENGGLHFTAYFECAELKLPCTVGKSWEIHGVTVKGDELSFVASQSEQRPVKFSVRTSGFITSASNWFKNTAEKIVVDSKGMMEATVPQNIVFHAGVTEFIPRKALITA